MAREVIYADMSRCDGWYGRVVAPGAFGFPFARHDWWFGDHMGTNDFNTVKEAEDDFGHEGKCKGKKRCTFSRTTVGKQGDT